MLDRIDEVQAHSTKGILRASATLEDEDFLTEFKRKGLGSTMSGSQSAKLKKMLNSSNLENDLANLREADDLDALYDDEVDDELNEDDYSLSMTQPSKEEIERMIKVLAEEGGDDLARDE